MIHPKYEQILGVENNAFTYLCYKDSNYYKQFIDRTAKNSQQRINLLSFFSLMAKQWTGENFHTSLRAKPVVKNGLLNPDLHPPMVTLLHKILEHAEKYDMYVMVDTVTRPAIQVMSEFPNKQIIYTQRSLDDSLLPYAEKFAKEFREHKNLIVQVATESFANPIWEDSIAKILKLNGIKFVSSSPLSLSTRNALLQASWVNFICIHGMWMNRFHSDLVNHRKYGSRVWFSSDGKSELSGRKASPWYQWGVQRYGKLPKPWVIREEIQLLAQWNIGKIDNFSGAVERAEPLWPLYDQSCKEHFNAFKL